MASKSIEKKAKVTCDQEVVKVPNVSYECLEAIELLLMKNPRERISIFDFLHHPWLQNHQKLKNRTIWGDSYSSNEETDSLEGIVSAEEDGEAIEESKKRVTKTNVMNIVEDEDEGITGSPVLRQNQNTRPPKSFNRITLNRLESEQDPTKEEADAQLASNLATAALINSKRNSGGTGSK